MASDLDEAATGLPAALDFDALRDRAIARLQQLAGQHWTDHNTHDPGITLLEQLCYALTDLGYRTGYPVQDLLASLPAAEGATTPGLAGLYGPAQVLPSGPVTADDLRRLVIDLPGVKNAWVDTPDLPLALHDAAQALLAAVSEAAGIARASPNVTLLSPRGLYRVRIEKSGLGEDIDGGALARAAAQRLQQWRGLGEDVADIVVLDRQPVALDGVIELAAGVDATATLTAVFDAMASYMSPPLPFRSLREMLDRGWRVDQIFEGPLLQRGFLDPVEWAGAERRGTLRVSDLIQVVMAVPGVQAVKRLGFLRDGLPSGDWLLPIADDRCASFDMPGSRLQLERAGLRVDHPALRAQARRQFEVRQGRDAMPPPVEAIGDALAPPRGRRRNLAQYLSVQHQLPLVYGVGPAGLSGQEPPQRHAQARQLKAYLTLFDQLLANQFAQLAQAGRLLSFDDDGLETVFGQAVPDDGGALRLDSVRRPPQADAAAWLARITADPWDDPSAAEARLAHRHRLADHLLARLGERWGEYRPLPRPVDDPAVSLASAAGDEAAAASPRERALRDKQAFLRDYPVLSVRRGLGVDALAGDAGDAAGLVQRLSRLLGLAEDALPLQLVEHILLRPLPGDAHQRGPLLRGAVSADPFSLQLSLVLPAQDQRWADADLRQRLARSVWQETPAHLSVRLLWLDGTALQDFTRTHARWRRLWRDALRRRHGLDEAPAGEDHQVELRSARNRLIDALGLGDTFPLTDLTVADGSPGGGIKVAHGRSARIAIDAAEAGVRYELRGPDGAPLRDAGGQLLPAVAAMGQDGRLVLETPAITDDITFRIQATKLATVAGLAPQEPLLLSQGAPVKVGLDTSLAIELPELPVLDGTLPNPQPGDVRRGRFGEPVAVLVHLSQEGVAYALVLDGQVQDDVVIGDLATIRLQSPPLTEDTTIAVQATKRFSGGAGGAEERQLLDARLQVAVSANPYLALQLLPGPVVDHAQAEAVLRLPSSQASASYRVWVRPVRDAEWRRDIETQHGAGLFDAEARRMAVGELAWPVDGGAPAGFVALGDDAVPGNGGAIDLPLNAPTADLVCLVQAIKHHAAGGERSVVSQTGLDQAQLLLVRPDTRPALRLALVQRQQGLAELRLQGGQPGVAYHVQPLPDGAPWPMAAYVHQHDDRDPRLNKGLSQLVVGVDFAVAGDPDPDTPADALDAVATASPDAAGRLPREQQRPAPPQLALAALEAGLRFALLAVKVQTGVEAMLALPARLRDVPEASVETAWLAPGAHATVRVAASSVSEQYQLWRQGTALEAPQAGNGGDLVLDAGPVFADGQVVVRAQGEARDAQPLYRERLLALRVLPRDDLALQARRGTVAAGEGTEIMVAGSQIGVLYQLQAGEAGALRPVGDPLPGQGDGLALPTGGLRADTRFTVLATRSDDPIGSVLLAGNAWVRLQPAEPPA